MNAVNTHAQANAYNPYKYPELMEAINRATERRWIARDAAKKQYAIQQLSWDELTDKVQYGYSYKEGKAAKRSAERIASGLGKWTIATLEFNTSGGAQIWATVAKSPTFALSVWIRIQ